MQYFQVPKQKNQQKCEFSETVTGFHIKRVAAIKSILAPTRIPFTKAVWKHSNQVLVNLTKKLFYTYLFFLFLEAIIPLKQQFRIPDVVLMRQKDKVRRETKTTWSLLWTFSSVRLA